MAHGRSGKQIIRRKLRALSATTFTANSRIVFFVNSENYNESNLRETGSIRMLVRQKIRIFQIRYPTIDQTESSQFTISTIVDYRIIFIPESNLIPLFALTFKGRR